MSLFKEKVDPIAKIVLPTCNKCSMEIEDESIIERCSRCEKIFHRYCIDYYNEKRVCKACIKYYEEVRPRNIRVQFANSANTMQEFKAKGRINLHSYEHHGHIAFMSSTGKEIIIPFDNVLWYEVGD